MSRSSRKSPWEKAGMMQNKKIAVTGGLGSGKSAFCDLLRAWGYHVLSCDDISRALWKEDAYRALLSAAFPDCLSDGTLDKKKLSRKVFSDTKALQTLNEIAHPRIMGRLSEQMDACKGAVFAEVPLLFESGSEGMFDAVIALRRAQGARIDAVRQRDGMKAEEALARMQNQFDPSRLEEKNCLIVENYGDMDALAQQAKNALRMLGIR